MVFGKNNTNTSNSVPDDDEVQMFEDFTMTPSQYEEEEEEEEHVAGASQSQGKQKQTYNDKSLDEKPLYKEVTLVGAVGSKNPGGCKKWVCKYCKVEYSSSYTRIHNHFFGPPLGRKPDFKRCPVMISERDTFEKLQKRVKQAEKVGVSKSLKNSVVTQKKNLGSKSIDQSMAIMERSEVDLKVVKALCANGIPFNVLRNPHFREMINAIRKAPVGYKAPSSEKARTNLLDTCVRDVEKDLAPFKDTWHSQGISIVSDGWTNINHKPLINVLAVNSRGSMFMYTEDFSRVEKMGKAIAKFLIKAIESVGSSNVFNLVTDNATNCKAAGKEIEKQYKHIFWSPCCVHTLNLIFKDFASRFDWLHDTYKKGKMIVKYFLNHGQALSIFRENSKLELLKVAKTRFASHYILLKRLFICREALSTTIALNSWREFSKYSDAQSRNTVKLVVETIRDDVFWDEVESIQKIIKLVYLLIKFCDGEGSKMGEIYEKMDHMLGEIYDVMKDSMYSSYFTQVKDIVTVRWDKMTIPLHCLGFALTPRFYDTRYLEMLAPGGERRRAPNLDREVIEGVMEAFKRISENREEERMLREQFATFHMKKGLYSLGAAQLDAAIMEAIDWWSTYGAETPELAEVAKKVLSQPISSSSAERNWSTYSYIHNVKMNRLNSKTADKLVYVHSNVRLISRFSSDYNEGPHKKWDIDPESTDLESSRVEIEDIEEEEDYDNGNGKKQRVE